MENKKIIYLDHYRKKKKVNESLTNEIIKDQKDLDYEERLKTLNLFMKVIATMHKESYK